MSHAFCSHAFVSQRRIVVFSGLKLESRAKARRRAPENLLVGMLEEGSQFESSDTDLLLTQRKAISVSE